MLLEPPTLQQVPQVTTVVREVPVLVQKIVKVPVTEYIDVVEEVGGWKRWCKHLSCVPWIGSWLEFWQLALTQ